MENNFIEMSPDMTAEFCEKAATMDRGDPILLKVLRDGKIIAL